MAQTRNIDYATTAKRGFLLGAGLFALGALGEFGSHALLGSFPAWVDTVLLDMELLGIVIGLLAPLVFGIVLPLTE